MTQAFNLSQFANNVNSSGKADLTTAVTGILPVANGGSGAATFSSGSVLLGSGTSSFGTVAPGASGNLLTSNGSTWTSQAAPITGQNIVVYNATGNWTVPLGITKALITVYGGGSTNYAIAGTAYSVARSGGHGGFAIVLLTGLTGGTGYNLTIGGAGTTGGTTTFNTSGGTALITCTGGYGGTSTSDPGVNGSASNTSGTAIVLSACGTPYAGNYAFTYTSAYSPYSSHFVVYNSMYQSPGILGAAGYGRAAFGTGTGGGSATGGAIAIQY